MYLIRRNSKKELDELKLDENCDVNIEGNFNVTLNADLDGTGGFKRFAWRQKTNKTKQNKTKRNETKRNETKQNETKQKQKNKTKPIKQRRLDLWLINSTIQEEVENVESFLQYGLIISLSHCALTYN